MEEKGVTHPDSVITAEAASGEREPKILLDKNLGRIVVLEECELSLRVRCIDHNNAEFWHPRAKLYPIKSKPERKPKPERKRRSVYPSINRRSADMNDEPWRVYVKEMGSIYVSGKIEKLQKFFTRLYEANGQQLTPASQNVFVDSIHSKHWGVTLHLYIPQPLPEDFPRNIHVGIPYKGMLQVSDGILIWDLLDNGMLIQERRR